MTAKQDASLWLVCTITLATQHKCTLSVCFHTCTAVHQYDHFHRFFVGETAQSLRLSTKDSWSSPVNFVCSNHVTICIVLADCHAALSSNDRNEDDCSHTRCDDRFCIEQSGLFWSYGNFQGTCKHTLGLVWVSGCVHRTPRSYCDVEHFLCGPWVMKLRIIVPDHQFSSHLNLCRLCLLKRGICSPS